MTRKPITSPAIAPDDAFISDLVARRDQAANEEHALRSQYLTQEAYFDREAKRLQDRRDKTLGALTVQIEQQARIVSMTDAALEPIHGNVVAMRRAAE